MSNEKSMVERFGKRYVCRLCTKATDTTCSGCERPYCPSCWVTHASMCPRTALLEEERETV